MRPSILPECLLVLFCLLFQSGCYYLTEGSRLLSIYGKGQSIEEVLASRETPADETLLLRNVQRIRQYATQTLGLKTNDNYTRYIRLDRDFLATIVSACDADRFNQYMWDYIFMGKLPYKGFFEREDAIREAKRLDNEGYDVFVRNVDAFSTLGFFSDPVFSFMKDYSLGAIAGILFHEQTHATFYFKADVDFSENIASFVGDEATLLYLAEEQGPESAELKRIQLENRDRIAFQEQVELLYDELDALYKKGLPPSEVVSRKSGIIREWKRRFSERYDGLFATDNYRRVSEIGINNAWLMTFRNYTVNQDDIKDLFMRSGLDLPGFIRLVATIPQNGEKPLERLRELVQAKAESH